MVKKQSSKTEMGVIRDQTLPVQKHRIMRHVRYSSQCMQQDFAVCRVEVDVMEH